jgi:hypothetical protein
MAPLLAEIRFYVVSHAGYKNHAMYLWKNGVPQMTICTITVIIQSRRCVAFIPSQLYLSVVLQNQLIVKPCPPCNWVHQQASCLEVFVSIF